MLIRGPESLSEQKVYRGGGDDRFPLKLLIGQELQSFAIPAISDPYRANRKGFSARDWRFPEKVFCIREQATLLR
jgi:hypothetical protein